MEEQIYLTIENTRTKIYGASSAILEEIDKVTSFLTPAMTGVDVKRYNTVDLDFAWDGWVRFLDREESPPSVPSGLRDIVISRLQALRVPFQVQDARVPPDLDFPRYPNPIPLWEHQTACKKAMIENGDVVARMPPRAGKTRTLLETVRALSLPTLWIAPTTSIVDQTIRSGREWFPEHDVVQVTSANWQDHTNTLLTVCTAGGMLQLPSEFFQTRKQLVCDEVHHFLEHGAWGKKLAKETQHIFHRKGMTGTFFRSNGDDLALLAFLGRVGFSIESKELLAAGHLVPTYACFIPIDGPRIKQQKGGHEFFGPMGSGTLGLVRHAHRNDVVASVAKHLQNLGRTVLILVATKAQGYTIKKRLDSLFPPKAEGIEFDAVEFASTDRKKQVVQKLYASFIHGQEVKILIGTSMVGEGVDLPPADALVYAAGRKAAVTYIQALYRVATAYQGKKYAVLVDFADKHHKTLLGHSRQRWVVAASDPVFQMANLSGLEEFLLWSSSVALPKK